MKKIIAVVLAVSCMLLQGCFTVMSVENKQYWAVPVAVPLDAATLPVQVGIGYYILSAFAGAK